MPAAAPISKHVAEIAAGMGPVTLAEALGAAAGATGITMFVHRTRLWERLSPAAQRECELLDEDMPAGWWHRTTGRIAGSLFSGHGMVWQHGEWDARQTANGSTVVVTPELDEETGELV